MSKRSVRSRRDAPHAIASGTLHDPFASLADLLAPMQRMGSLDYIGEDRRYWSPTAGRVGSFRVTPMRGVSHHAPARLRALPWPAKGHAIAVSTGPGAPELSMCAKRRRRREVLHARGKAGGRVAKPKRGPYSSFTCKG